MLAYIFASTYLHNMKARRDVYQAIADPTRRAIINMIAMEPHNVNAIAEKFKVTRQAISLHIQLLADCGLLVVEQQGRERLCKAQLNPLGEVSQWIEPYRQHFEKRLDKLESYIKKIKKQRDGINNK
jgi:DNA-binding transcriptional ArsR family regulator